MWWKPFSVGVLICITILILMVPLPSFLISLGMMVSWTGSLYLFCLLIFNKDHQLLRILPLGLMGLTLIRLALNIASTRLILSTQSGGELIDQMVQILVGERYIVAVLCFIAFLVIHYLVLAQGAERIAQVSARFALDALPEAQRSIMQSMAQGHLPNEIGRQAHERLRLRSELCGTLDGVMRFIKGDAIATILLMTLNVIGGVSLAFTAQNYSWGAALQIYGSLTVADALMAQIPALLNAMTATYFVVQMPYYHETRYELKNTSILALNEMVSNQKKRGIQNRLHQRLNHSIKQITSQQKTNDQATFATQVSLICFAIFIPWSGQIPYLFLLVITSLFFLYKYGSHLNEINRSSKVISTWSIHIHPILKTSLPSSALMKKQLYHLLLSHALPARPIQIVYDREIAKGSYQIFCNQHLITESLIYPDHVFIPSFIIPQSQALLAQESTEIIWNIPRMHPMWGGIGYWIDQKALAKVMNRKLATSAESFIGGLSTAHYLYADLVKHWRQQVNHLWNIEDTWDLLSLAHPTLQQQTLRPPMTLMHITGVLRTLSAEGITCEINKLLEALGSTTYQADDLLKLYRGEFCQAWIHIRQYLGFDILMPTYVAQEIVGYILIEKEFAYQAYQGWSENDWTQIIARIEEALLVTQNVIILCAQPYRRSVAQAIQRRVPALSVLAPNEVPSHVTLEQFGWFTSPQ